MQAHHGDGRLIGRRLAETLAMNAPPQPLPLPPQEAVDCLLRGNESTHWQDYDQAPRFPRLIKFLDFWSHNLDGPLASVRVAHAGIVGPLELRHIGHEWRLH